MISKTWQGYYISKRRKGTEFKLYVKSIYKGKITWTTDYTYAKHYTEKTAMRLDAEIDEGIRNGEFDNDILADSEVQEVPEVVEESKTMDRQTINAKFKELAQWKMMEAEAKANRDAIEAELKAYMAEAELTEIIGDEHKATWKEETRNSFDSKAFQEAGYTELYNKFRKPSTVRKFIFA